MEKIEFKINTRYTLTWRAPDGKLRPVNLYIYRLYDKFMIARMTDKEGFLHKIAYEDIIKIVLEKAVSPEEHFSIPAAVLDEKSWKDRTMMQRYSTSPSRGK